MERLTKRMNSGRVSVTATAYIEKATQEALQKLADYEDAEEQGRLDIHPCRESDAVYILRTRQDHYAEEPYMEIEVRVYRKAMLKDINKTVFLTCEAAEAALKGAGHAD